MRILLTNDDGFGSPGITLLASGLRKAGHRVFMIAPERNQSGVSHAITFFNGPCKLTDVAEDTWSCGGTPVDCVVIALMGGIPELSAVLHAPPDLIVSGINQGANLGTDILYSGTAAAARQGSLNGIPSLALSLVEGDSVNHQWYWDMAVGFSVDYLDRMMAYWKPQSFINVNIPNRREKPAALVHAFPSLRYYNDSLDIYHATDGYRYCFTNAGKVSARPEQGSDWAAVTGNNASLSEVYIHPLLLESVMKREGNCGGKPVNEG